MKIRKQTKLQITKSEEKDETELYKCPSCWRFTYYVSKTEKGKFASCSVCGFEYKEWEVGSIQWQVEAFRTEQINKYQRELDVHKCSKGD